MNNKEILTPGASAHDEDQIDLVELLFKILAHWKWITATAFIGVALAFTFNHFAPPSFQVNSTLIVKDNKSDGLNIANVFSDNPLKGDVSIDNQIEILRSFSLNHQALENLASDISWYKAMPIGDFNVYGREPYRVAFDKTAFNLKDVPVYIDPIDNEQYRITVDASTKILGIETEVDFEAKAKFNEPFENQYFSFTIQKTAPPEEGDFYFVFNDFDKQTLKNIDKLVVSRVNQNADLIKIEFTGDNSLQHLASNQALLAYAWHWRLC
ncbi:Wzz/FepE/Etk N-terminal domain-containing protein [Mangrovibacterium marinum]|uniref:Wzz/FepE/Etk N-terminal domain-containing protein n=1 Tax=Mangrovibacterium marinum TaxID=1639118 RepID=UPI002A187515|nr:Wzz/FepE/Etk N-terminal domain-containing protein [Mangrovibacterium marinum]